jgi:hypothetical protein
MRIHCLQKIWNPIMCTLTVYKKYGIQECAHSLFTNNMDFHNVRTHFLQKIWNPIMCALTVYKQYGLP